MIITTDTNADTVVSRNRGREVSAVTTDEDVDSVFAPLSREAEIAADFEDAIRYVASVIDDRDAIAVYA